MLQAHSNRGVFASLIGSFWNTASNEEEFPPCHEGKEERPSFVVSV